MTRTPKPPALALPIRPEYPWDSAPTWAKWAATDRDGQQWWYQNKPKRPRHYSQWVEPTPGSEIKSIGGDYPVVKSCPHWRDTLQARPAKPKRRTAPARGKGASVADDICVVIPCRNRRLAVELSANSWLQHYCPDMDRIVVYRMGVTGKQLPVKRAGARV